MHAVLGLMPLVLWLSHSQYNLFLDKAFRSGVSWDCCVRSLAHVMLEIFQEGVPDIFNFCRHSSKRCSFWCCDQDLLNLCNRRHASHTYFLLFGCSCSQQLQRYRSDIPSFESASSWWAFYFPKGRFPPSSSSAAYVWNDESLVSTKLWPLCCMKIRWLSEKKTNTGKWWSTTPFTPHRRGYWLLATANNLWFSS